MIFAGKPRPDCVWIGGKKLVEGGYHRSRDRFQARFKAVIQDLIAALVEADEVHGTLEPKDD